MIEYELMTKFEKVQDYFRNNYWTLAMVADAVNAGWITAEEFETITGKNYAEQT